MARSLRLISIAELEEITRSRRIPERFANEVLVCTAMEYVQLAERIKKSRSSLDLQSFCSNALEDLNNLIVLELDGERLLQALFEFTDANDICGIWPEIGSASTMSDAVHDKIGHLVRRLILRPTAEAWWDVDVYRQMEAWYAE